MKTLKSKILVSTGIIVTIGFCIFALIFISLVNNSVGDMVLEKSIQEVRQVAGQAEIILENEGSTAELQSFVESQIEDNDYLAYAVVIDKTVTAVAHSDKEKIGKSYADDPYTVDGAKNGKEMNSRFYADVQKAWTYDIMVPIEVNGQNYGAMDIGVYENYVSDFVKHLTILAAIITIIILVILALIMILICNKLFQPLKQLGTQCSSIGNGDFSQKFDAALLKRKDEIGVMAMNVSNMQNSLHELISETAVQTEEVVAVSEDIEGKTSAAAGIADKIGDAVTKVVDGSENQNKLLSDATDMMEQINQGMEEVAENIMNVTSSSSQAVEKAKTGNDVVQDMVHQMSTISDEVKNTAEKIDILNNKSKEIEKAVSYINDIASQTNLLALNASIEAARAGEQGRGFAVVADQVGQLAEQSSQVANEIVAIINEIKTSITASISSMKESEGSISKGLNLADEAGTSFNEILNNSIFSECYKISQNHYKYRVLADFLVS